MFSFFNKVKLHRQILEQFEATDFERVDDIDDIEEADPNMRRLVAIMS